MLNFLKYLAIGASAATLVKLSAGDKVIIPSIFLEGLDKE